MKILRPTARLPEGSFEIFHAPSCGRDYSGFLSCIQWEFGFYCAFCLLHHSDFSRIPDAKLGLFWIEHLKRKEEHPELADSYANCCYSCRLCNSARGRKPEVGPRGETLLNPRLSAWNEHFLIADNEINYRSADDEAAVYTYSAYDLGDERKSRLREIRRSTIGECLQMLEEMPQLIDDLLTSKRLKAARTLRRFLKQVCRQLAVYRVVPENTPTACECSEEPRLPDFALGNSLDVDIEEYLTADD